LVVCWSVEDGILFGPFYEGCDLQRELSPIQSPVPFLFVRQGVISDWNFFLDNQDWLNYWAHRFGESAVHALAEELRRLPWRARRDLCERGLASKGLHHAADALPEGRWGCRYGEDVELHIEVPITAWHLHPGKVDRDMFDVAPFDFDVLDYNLLSLPPPTSDVLQEGN
jgi:hypothetical protein